MPNLPTISVTQAQADRMLAVWGSVDNYLRWLQEQIINYVANSEYAQDMQQAQDAAAAKRQQTMNDLSQ